MRLFLRILTCLFVLSTVVSIYFTSIVITAERKEHPIKLQGNYYHVKDDLLYYTPSHKLSFLERNSFVLYREQQAGEIKFNIGEVKKITKVNEEYSIKVSSDGTMLDLSPKNIFGSVETKETPLTRLVLLLTESKIGVYSLSAILVVITLLLILENKRYKYFVNRRRKAEREIQLDTTLGKEFRVKQAEQILLGTKQENREGVIIETLEITEDLSIEEENGRQIPQENIEIEETMEIEESARSQRRIMGINVLDLSDSQGESEDLFEKISVPKEKTHLEKVREQRYKLYEERERALFGSRGVIGRVEENPMDKLNTEGPITRESIQEKNESPPKLEINQNTKPPELKPEMGEEKQETQEVVKPYKHAEIREKPIKEIREEKQEIQEVVKPYKHAEIREKPIREIREEKQEKQEVVKPYKHAEIREKPIREIREEKQEVVKPYKHAEIREKSIRETREEVAKLSKSEQEKLIDDILNEFL